MRISHLHFLDTPFKPRVAMNREETRYLNFLPGVSKEAVKAMNQTLRGWKLQLKK